MNMTIDDPRAKHTHVFLNGEDVSGRCFEFEGPDTPDVEGPGTVGLYKKNGDRFEIAEIKGELELATEYLAGQVRWILTQ